MAASAGDNGEKQSVDSSMDARGMRAVVADIETGQQASFGRVIAALGGTRGIVESTLPAVVFIVSQTATNTLWFSVSLTAACLVVLTLLRAIQKSGMGLVASGAIGAAIGLVFALVSGRSEGAFVPGLWINAAYFAVLLASVLARHPLSGYVVGSFVGDLTAWRSSRMLRGAHMRATLAFALVSAIRVAVVLPLYLAAQQSGDITIVGTAKLIVGLPLTGLALFYCYVVLAPAYQAAQRDAPEDPSDTDEKAPTAS